MDFKCLCETIMSICTRVLFCLISGSFTPLTSWAGPDFFCAGFYSESSAPRVAKLAQTEHIDTRAAVVLFAEFNGSANNSAIPSWATSIFDPERPGSFTHFYNTMSFGQLRVLGEVAPRRYQSRQSSVAYISADPSERGEFGRFSSEILAAADRDIDFSRYDNDGPDGIPNSGDDDGIVDALFIVLPSMPPNFIIGNATGVATLGLAVGFTTDDLGANNRPMSIISHRGSIVLGRDFHETVATMAHEYGHILGLPDLFNADYLQTEDPGGPENDSAGIGNWGLMGWGTLGWNRNDGPNSFSAWSRMQLGWAQVLEPEQARSEIRLEPVAINGQLYKIPIANREFFLLENRHRSSYYDRKIPANGLLVWHIVDREELMIDLECADGRWQEAGFPLGQIADAINGGDNLDFWAHDSDYSDRKLGNFGDATDPFDGVQFSAFTPQSNPSSASVEDIFDIGIAVEDIHYEDEQLVAQLQTAPASARLEDFTIVHELVDGFIVVGGEVRFNFRLVNQGGLPLRDLRTRIVTDDPWIEVLQDGMLGSLEAGAALHTRALQALRPKLRFSPELTVRHTAEVTLQILNGDQVLLTQPLNLKALPFVRLSGRVTGPDGQPAVGIEISVFGRLSPAPTALTDEEGTYEFELPGGNYRIRAVRTLSPVFLNEDKVIDFVLPGNFQVRGQILDETRNSREGEMIFYSLEGGLPPINVSASSFGYDIILPPGRFHVAMGFSDGSEGTKNLGAIDIRSSQELDLNPPIGTWTQGKLLDSQGFPIRERIIPITTDNAVISAISAQQAVFAFQTRTDGTFRLKAVPGVFEVSVITQDQRWALEPQQIEAEQPFELRLPAANAMLSGQVFDSGGAPITQGNVLLVDQPIDLVAKRFHTSVQIDTTGAYQIRQVTGTYTLINGHFVDEHNRLWQGTVSSDVELRDAMRRNLTVPGLDQTHQLLGQVEYEPGLPQTDVLLVLYDTSQKLIARVTIPADEGSYNLSLNSGNYQVWARLHSVVNGIEKVYDLGALELTEDLTWNAQLNMAVTAIEEKTSLEPKTFRLEQNYPNPFNNSTTIRYGIDQGRTVRLYIYNLIGQRVAKLVDGFQPVGSYQIAWNGVDEQGRTLASGVYIYRLQAGHQIEVHKLILLK